MVSDEAVEAAARKYRDIAGYDWDDMKLAPEIQEILAVQISQHARAILEAAAPHLHSGPDFYEPTGSSAKGWDEGFARATFLAAWAIGGKVGERPDTTNPYRSVSEDLEIEREAAK